MAHLACYVRYHGCFSELYARGSWWEIMVMGVVSDAPCDESSSLDKGLEVGCHIPGESDRCRLVSGKAYLLCYTC
jgi:hypothetical protein